MIGGRGCKRPWVVCMTTFDKRGLVYMGMSANAGSWMVLRCESNGGCSRCSARIFGGQVRLLLFKAVSSIF